MGNSQKGFAALEVLLILIIIAIIGGTGYFVWHSKSQTDKALNNAANLSQGAAASKKTEASSSDVYGGWKTFTAPREKFTLKYPSDWKVTQGYNPEIYDLIAPDGLIVRYVYLDTLNAEDGGCGHQSACPTQKILSIDTIKPTNHTDIQLIKTAPDENTECYGLYLNEADAAHKPKVGENNYNDSMFSYSLKDSEKGRYTVFATNSVAGKTTFDCKDMTQTQFFSNQSVVQADKILRSISF
jgi:hypothetical protein